MNDLALEAFKAHAAAEYPREACGLLVDGVYVPCDNIASTPSEHFVLAPASYLAASRLGKIEAVCHTHPNNTCEPSEADLSACEATKLPWYILSWPTAKLRSFAPSGYEAPLIGRTFVHGVHDCYSLARDYYKRTLGLDLPDFDRRDMWWNEGGNLYVENFQKAGFVRVDDAVREHDGLLMQIVSKVTNHGAVYIGDGLILHHVQNRLSCRTPYGGYWAKNTTHHLRHVSQL